MKIDFWGMQGKSSVFLDAKFWKISIENSMCCAFPLTFPFKMLEFHCSFVVFSCSFLQLANMQDIFTVLCWSKPLCSKFVSCCRFLCFYWVFFWHSSFLIMEILGQTTMSQETYSIRVMLFWHKSHYLIRVEEWELPLDVCVCVLQRNE